MEARQDKWREVLIVTGGMTPQVVTETVYELARRVSAPLVPAKIVCVVTGGALDGFSKPLEAALGRLRGQLDTAADWQRRKSASHLGDRGLYLEVPRDGNGRVIEDIRSDSDAVRFGDLVSNIVRHETLDPGSRVHLSLAGGRKTMSFHAGMAMSLFGRPQDELSHVLVHPQEFEQCSEFWFPTTEDLTVRSRSGAVLNARAARVELALIPYIRVRDRLRPALLAQAMDYASYVRQLNAVLGVAPLSLELVTSECRVRIGDISNFTLPNAEFALYQLMAEWRQSNCPGASSQGIGPEHCGWMTARMFEYPEEYRPNPIERFAEIYDDSFRSGTIRGSGILNRVSADPKVRTRRNGNRDAIAEWKSRLTKALQDELHHPDLADRFGAPLIPLRPPGVGNRVVFGLRLDPREIVIRQEEPLVEEPTP
jgi:CRISPR-associated protein (TIGR02584 family)